jgi:hypothetical protein
LETAGVIIATVDGEGNSAGSVIFGVTPNPQEMNNPDKTIGRKIDCLNINLLSPFLSL